MIELGAVADPRVFPDVRSAASEDARLYVLAADSLAAESRQRADDLERRIRSELTERLASGGTSLALLFAGAPSIAVARHLWRELDAASRAAAGAGEATLALTVFAMPIVIVSGSEGVPNDVVHSGTLRNPELLGGILRDHGALGGNRTFALADVLVGADAIDFSRLSEILAWQQLPESQAADFAPRALTPSPINLAAGSEGVHLRFLVGSAVASQGSDLFADTEVGKWGVPFTQELSRQLALAGNSVLALARAPQRPLLAVRTGRAAQREIGARIFASNAIRKLRASVGEPAAVISAHRAPDAPGGGELRLSLSSPFAPRDAEGFRCPLYALDRVGDVASMLVQILTDCRVTDVRIAAGIHADRDSATGRTLLFKPDTLPDSTAVH